MALIKHRKLFPSSSANQTIDGCPEICDVPTYTYPDYDVLPPPLSQPPPPKIYFSSNKSDQHVSPYVIIIVSLLASLFLLVSWYVIIVKYCNGCSRFGRRTSRSLGEAEEEEEFIDEVHGPTLDHPIWYIATVGLRSSDINSITIFKYKKCDNLIEGTDCSVCLSEFRDDEMLRLLPKCNHAFHISCIDTWLRSHTNCPLCRAGIVPNNVVNSTGNSAAIDQSSSVLRRNEEPCVENVPDGGESMDVNQVRNEDLGQVGDVAGTENSESGDQRVKIKNFKAEVLSNGNGIFWVVDTSSNNDEIGSENTKQRMKRSFSVDLDSIGDIAEETRFEERSHSTAEPLPLKMKKSFSYSGISFLSRQYRSQSTILPL